MENRQKGWNGKPAEGGNVNRQKGGRGRADQKPAKGWEWKTDSRTGLKTDRRADLKTGRTSEASRRETK